MHYKTDLPSLLRDSSAELKRLPSLVTAALLLALGLVLSGLGVYVTPTLRITFAFLANAVNALLFGPAVAMLTSGLGDILGYFLHPTGPYFPPYTLTAMLSGFLYGSFLYHRPIKLGRVIAAKASVTFLSNILLNTLWSSLLYGKSFLALFPLRFVKNIALLPVEIAMLFFFAKTAKKIYSATTRNFHPQQN
ncbi:MULTISPECIES: folate family ECF transporter S component [Caproicibacterium]|uniref:Folate family ECF transporter S component n=1 Tax=Caproicibacterium argilliputei TaxID=3030016 RepID=A0AA97H168_9FIRM|nr:folate family ECF transporter S component [Caproicibacterium argilliputei]WOC31305.1 folate family ECF transporter S component [Caproicibacterium argilliputei]